MGSAGCYTLDLYCDCVICHANPISAYNAEWHEYQGTQSGFSQYHGETYQEAAKTARSKGWYISRDRCVCFAPGHPHKQPESG